MPTETTKKFIEPQATEETSLFDQVIDKAEDNLTAGLSALEDACVKLYTDIKENIKDMIKDAGKVVTSVGDAAMNAVDAVSSFGKDLYDGANDISEDVSDMFKLEDVSNKNGEMQKTLLQQAQENIANLGNKTLKNLADGVADLEKMAGDWADDGISKLQSSAPDILKK